jgi:hypothetical protein
MIVSVNDAGLQVQLTGSFNDAPEPCMLLFLPVAPPLVTTTTPLPAAAARSPATGWICQHHQPEHQAAGLPVNAAAADLLLPTPGCLPTGTCVSGHSDWQVSLKIHYSSDPLLSIQCCRRLTLKRRA